MTEIAGLSAPFTATPLMMMKIIEISVRIAIDFLPPNDQAQRPVLEARVRRSRSGIAHLEWMKVNIPKGKTKYFYKTVFRQVWT